MGLLGSTALFVANLQFWAIVGPISGSFGSSLGAVENSFGQFWAGLCPGDGLQTVTICSGSETGAQVNQD